MTILKNIFILGCTIVSSATFPAETLTINNTNIPQLAIENKIVHLKKTQDDILSKLIALQSTLNSKINIHDAITVSIENQKKITKSIDKLNSEIHNLKTTLQEILSDVTSLKKDINAETKSQNELFAERAFSKAETLKNSRKQLEKDLAEIYYISAINNNPTESYISSYVNFVLANHSDNYDKLTNLSSIVDVVLYKANPSDISNILKIKEKIIKQQQAILDKTNTCIDKSLQEEKFLDKFNNLKNKQQSISKKSNNEIIESTKNYLNELNNLYTNDQDELKAEEKEEISKEIVKANTILSAYITIEETSTIIKNAKYLIDQISDKGTDFDNEQIAKTARYHLNSANSLSIQVLTIDKKVYPDIYKKSQMLVNEIISNEDNINKKISDKHLKAAIKIYEKIREYKEYEFGTLTEQINTLQQDIAKYTAIYSNLDIKSQSKLSEKSKEIGKILTDLQKKRNKEYQIWAKKKIDNANNYKDLEQLKEINTSLLIPEVNNYYNAVLSKYISNKDEEINFLREKCQDSDKIKGLENF